MFEGVPPTRPGASNNHRGVGTPHPPYGVATSFTGGGQAFLIILGQNPSNNHRGVDLVSAPPLSCCDIHMQCSTTMIGATWQLSSDLYSGRGLRSQHDCN